MIKYFICVSFGIIQSKGYTTKTIQSGMIEVTREEYASFNLGEEYNV